ncbi:PAS domain-containing protein [Cryobacterium sinapicolor]|uniref:PAS domain-containing protein n=1 Tax=Cryobacterium sinapicolor TaxID=1259236 RepID=A0ABY2J0B7_9MICO|nr:PAS domain-containing protein [Cryobacterium sp. TMT3-29-2]TFC96537.1 PAS domain-containing protein [Cryobacterium sinapicolor]
MKHHVHQECSDHVGHGLGGSGRAVQSADTRAPAVDSYELLVEGAPDALLVLSQEGQVVLVNAAAEEMFGYCRSALVGEHYGIVLSTRPDSGAPDDSPGQDRSRNCSAKLIADWRRSVIAVRRRPVMTRMSAGSSVGSSGIIRWNDLLDP